MGRDRQRKRQVNAQALSKLPFSQKNPRAHKNKIGTFPPPPKPKNTPPLKRGIYGHGFPAERTHFFQASIKLAQPFPAPELRTNIFTDTRTFLIFRARTATFHFSESGGSLNRPDLFTELPLKSLPTSPFTELPPPFSLKSPFFTEKSPSKNRLKPLANYPLVSPLFLGISFGHCLRARKTTTAINLLWPKMARLGPPF